jgi:hypothetical protein
MRPSVPLRRAGLLVLFATAACEGGTTEPPRPASLVAITATTQSAVVASPVPVPPAVLVSDERGRAMPGVQVTFAITAGDGTVAAAPSLSDGAGIAVAGDWVTGRAAVENVLTASIPGVAPVLFRAGAAPGPAAAVEKTGGDGQTGAAGTPLADSIAVRVMDQYGNGVPNVLVNFVSSRGTLSATQVATGAQGHARVSLMLPTRTGTVDVVAGTGILAPQAFAATVTAGPPAAVTRVAGDGQRAHTGMAVPVAPSVRVTDSFGNLVPGRAVVFTPAPGSGLVTGGAAMTGSDGQAAVGRWTLGDPGVNRLIVRVAGLDSLVFTATATEPCGTRTYTLFSTLTDQLLAGRCTVGGRNAELYAFTVASTQCLEFRMNSAAFDTYLYLLANSGAVLAADDDSGGGFNSLIRRRLSAGSYFLAAASFDGRAGTFQLTSSVAADASCGPLPSSAIHPEKASR